ncbi:GNAT family N-acetyltransferase [soil metagenome]
MPVRPLSPTDLPRVLELNNAAVPAVGLLDQPGLEHLVSESSIAWAVCDAEAGELVGFCLVLDPDADYASVNFHWFAERYEDFVYLDRVVIDAAWKGQGLGRELYGLVEAHVAANGGAAWLCLEVNLRPRNDASLAFHERLGFSEVGQQETPYGALVTMQTKPLPQLSA